jgi:hypothetical protein
MAKFAFDAVDHRGNIVFNMVGMAVPAVFLWVSGTLHMQEVRCASNIARPTDASFLSLLDGFAINGYFQVPSVVLSCPEDDVTLWSWSTFAFVEPIFELAKTRTLNDTDVWTLSPYFRHKIVFSKCLEYRNLCVPIRVDVC